MRGRWLVLTPEEWGRRHIVGYMVEYCGFAPQQVIEGYPVRVNGQMQRADIVAVGSDSQPLVVVECKEACVKIDDAVLRQVVRYNSVLGCRYIVMTNGMQTYCYRLSDGSYIPMSEFPHFE